MTSPERGLITALETLTAPLGRALRVQRLVIAALAAVVVSLGGLEVWRLLHHEVVYVTLGHGLQRALPGALDEGYVADLAISTTRLMGNVDRYSVRDARRQVMARMSPDLRLRFAALSEHDVAQLEADDQWIYTPSVVVEHLEASKSALGARQVYTVTVRAQQVFGFLDRHSGRRDTRIQYTLEPEVHGDQARAFITALTWPNMLRSEGAIAYSPELKSGSS
jgi:hypothetical protein